MIKQVSINNFFSFGYKTQEVYLNPDTNILIGINGSGKSNFIKAIRLLYEGVVGKDGLEKLLMNDWGGFTNVSNFSKHQTEMIDLIYEFDKNSINKAAGFRGHRFEHNVYYQIIIKKAANNSFHVAEEIFDIGEDGQRCVFLRMELGHGQIISSNNEKTELKRFNPNNSQIPFKNEELILRQLSDPISYPILVTLKKAIEKIIIYDYFDTTANSLIRRPSAYNVEKKLLANGENLVQILQRMKNHHSLEYEKIERELTRINSMFKDISFDIVGSKSLLVLREKNLARSISVDHISDGTLRFLLLLAILYNPERGSLICLDEPEIGLHPDMIHTVAKAIQHASKTGTQIIIATHSPLLLNDFELDDIWIFEKNTDNQTIISSKSEEDFKDWTDQFLAGQMWLSGKIGGTRWQ